MVEATHTRYLAEDRSYFPLIKKDIHKRAQLEGFEQKRIFDIDLIVSEITSNLGKYAKQGELLAGFFKSRNEEYLELISIDKGPGIPHLSRMLQDGISSLANSMGHGFGSIKRLSDTFQVYSVKEWGTIVLSRIYKKSSTRKTKLEIRPIVIAKPGEELSGDAYFSKQTADYFKIFVGDGLGHGPDANFAVSEAITHFKAFLDPSPVETLRYLHQAIRKTRGAVATIATYHYKSEDWHIAGVGNISTKWIGQVNKSYISYNGIIGHNIPRTMNDTVINSGLYNKVIFCSDGIQSRWDNKFPLIDKYDPVIAAAAIYKDFARMTDDTSVICAKIKL